MISKYSLDDLNDINKLGKELNPNYQKLFHIDKLNPNEEIYVYKEDNNLLGFIHISVNYEVVDLLNIIVDNDHKHNHIGTSLINYMIDSLPKDVKRILLEVNENNQTAIEFYYKNNFKVNALRKKYYKNESALIMEREVS